MKSSLRFRIFFPVLILLILLPTASWLVFRLTSEAYMQTAARNQLKELSEEIDHLKKSKCDARGPDNDRERSKNMVLEARELMKKQDLEAELLILNSKEKIVYPAEENQDIEIQKLREHFLAAMEENGNVKFLNGPVPVGEERYLIHLVQLDSEENLRGKYFISYVRVMDNALMLSQASFLVLGITACLAVVSVVLVWLIAGSAAKPLKELGLQASRIARRDFCINETPCSVTEIEELRKILNEMAEQLEQYQNYQITFFQNVSHELRTPLMSICGYAQGIQQGVFPDTKKSAAIIAEESKRLKELVDDILTVSKMETAGMEMNPCRICMNDFMEEMIERLRMVRREITFDYQCPAEELFVIADVQLLDRSVGNLPSNCIRYARRQISVVLKDEGKELSLEIRDDGEGFSEEDLKHLFERFYKGKKGKFGLGLTISKISAELMGGSLNAGNYGQGAVFIFKLPKK